jgi:SAM-dependent methyltransferase
MRSCFFLLPKVNNNNNERKKAVTARIKGQTNGYNATYVDTGTGCPETTSEQYAQNQLKANLYKVRQFVIPMLEKTGAKTVLDVGCGVGEMVQRLREIGYDAYGTDLACLTKYWKKNKLSPNNFFCVDTARLDLPFNDEAIDFAFTFGAIEHIGTTNGFATLRPDYHVVRNQWLREIYRVTKRGGYMLVGGPNRNFPIDVAHQLGSNASKIEIQLSRLFKTSFHKTWGEYFLWGYRDFKRYLQGFNYRLEPLSIFRFLEYSRVPNILRPLVILYTKHLPKPLLGTGLNPWVMALIEKK